MGTFAKVGQFLIKILFFSSHLHINCQKDLAQFLSQPLIICFHGNSFWEDTNNNQAHDKGKINSLALESIRLLD